VTADDLDPARPTLVPEFRVRIVLPSGTTVLLARDSKADARATAANVEHGVATVEWRLVSPTWTPIPAKPVSPGARDREQ